MKRFVLDGNKVIIGSNELQERKATVKNMLSGEQVSVSFEEVYSVLKQR